MASSLALFMKRGVKLVSVPRALPAMANSSYTSGETYVSKEPRTSILMELYDTPGALHEVLKYFWKFDVSITNIESRPTKHDGSFEFYLDFKSCEDAATEGKLMSALKAQTSRLMVLDERKVPWFPRHISDLDQVANRILEGGTDLESDHPGFNDSVYRERRVGLAENAMKHRYGNPIPHIDYSKEELATWTAVYDKLESFIGKYACAEYLKILPLLQEHCNYNRDTIPQQADITKFLEKRTGFSLRPVAGLLSSRDFLNGLAFRTFFCTQYIRHHSKPLYTPEPDIVHELMGHVPMFADPDFADFSQEIGLASLGASDEDIQKLATCYWHSVEFGLCKQQGSNKAYGAGLLSSFGEMEYACAPYRPAGDVDYYPEYRKWDPKQACKQEFPITTYQPVYFVAESLSDVKDQMRLYCRNLQRPFHARYNPNTRGVWVDRAVTRDDALPVEENPYSK
jgi:phenylalanine-4-hydroxylase